MSHDPAALRRELLRLSADTDPRAAWDAGLAAWLARHPDCALRLYRIHGDRALTLSIGDDARPCATPGADAAVLTVGDCVAAPAFRPDGTALLPICAAGAAVLYLLAGPLPRQPLRGLAELAQHAFGGLARWSLRGPHPPIEDLADVQRALLPDDPQIPGLAYAIHYQPAAIAGGDYYDLMSLQARVPVERQHPEHHAFGCMVADVSGHGAGAAMEVVQFDAILRTWKGGDTSGPAAPLSYANRHFFSRRSRGRYLTAFALFHDPGRRELIHVCAGHPPALLRRGDQVIPLGEGGDIPLGVLREHVYTQHTLATEPGDTLILYTDGLIEACDGHGRRFGLPHLMALAASGSAEPARLRDRLRDAVHAHQGSDIGTDDQTLVVLRWS
ncbi:MAG: SpoIIE family protein phosphatase [Xanthomonadales bacterium]|nr:SpoIIE family protein phosphatase [Xanthomonadales bacterium]